MMLSVTDTGRTAPDDESDYGEITLEEQQILEALVENASNSYTAVASIPDERPLQLTDIEDYEDPSSILLPKILGEELWNPRSEQELRNTPSNQANTEGTSHLAVGQPHVDTVAAEERAERRRVEQHSASIEPPAVSPQEPDHRSPLLRFRTSPKKALSVTDLVSTAWCELQYFYTLSKHGRKRATPAMRQGTKVHKKLEQEVYTSVPVQIVIKEDSWGLRIWNVIQGLRTLRDTGRTRELEVWGVIEGQIVNGVIDELSYDCPDPSHKEGDEEPGNGTKSGGKNALPEDQTTITNYLQSTGDAKTFSQLGLPLETHLDTLTSEHMQSNGDVSQHSINQKERKIYITDVKTRGVRSLPSTLATRPTEIQLQLYHRLLSSLAQGGPALSVLAKRYKFNPDVTFSDSFIAQVGGLNEQVTSSQDEFGGWPVPSSQASIDVLLGHNNIASLWGLMIDQFRETFLLDKAATPSNSVTSPTPQSDSIPTRLSSFLTASYIHTSSSTHIGNKYFQHYPSALAAYVADEMAWWRGERKARGVESLAEVTIKCQRCEFAADCEWMKEKDNEIKERVKLRRQSTQEGAPRAASG